MNGAAERLGRELPGKYGDMMFLCSNRMRSAIAYLALVVFMGLTANVPLLAKGDDLRFVATVGAVNQTSNTDAIVTVIIKSFEVPIVVNADTEIESAGDEVGLDGLSTGVFVKISGFYSPDGITAEEIDILDARGGEFRLRGTISAAGPVSGGTLVTLLGVGVLVDGETAIVQRGSDNVLTGDDLTAGLLADARGIEDDGQLLVTRLVVGHRGSDGIRIEFEGTIVSVVDRTVLVDTGGGGLARVVVTAETRIGGKLAEGQFVEVKGMLNEELAVIASTIKVDTDGDGDADDDHADHGGDEPRKLRNKVPLERVGDTTLEGEARTELMETRDGKGNEALEISFHSAQRNEDFRVRVTLASDQVVEFGAVQANGGGRVKIKFHTGGSGRISDIGNFLPAGESVRDIRSVEILDDQNNVVLAADLE